MNILFTTDHYSPQINGIVYHVENLKKELEKRGHTVYVITAQTPGKKTRMQEERVFRLPSFPLGMRAKDMVTLPYSPKIFRELEKIDFDIVHNHMFFTGYFGLTIAKRLNIPSIVTFHTLMSHYIDNVLPGVKTLTHPVAHMVTRDYFKEHNLIIAPSEKAVQELKKARVSTDITLLHNGIDLQRFHTATSSVFRKEFFIDDKRPLIVQVGILEKGKNVDLAIDAIHKLVQTIPTVQFAIIGDGKERKRLERLITKYKLGRNAFITGFLDQELVASAGAAADIVLFTSDTDTFPTVLIEALALGKPIVAIKDKAIEGLVKHNENGLVAAKNPVAISKALETLLNSADKRKSFGKKSRELSSRFSLERYTTELEKIYQQEALL